MSIFDTLINRLSDNIANRLLDDKNKPMLTARNYRMGIQTPQLKLRPGQFDDNITLNFISLIANRIVSQVVGSGLDYDFEGDVETDSERWLKACMKANHEEILFHRAVLAGVEAGTGYLFIQPDGIVGEDSDIFPRLTLLESAFVSIETLPEDFEAIISYTVKYKFVNVDGKESARKRIIKRTDYVFDDSGNIVGGGDQWEIIDYILNPATNKFDEVARVAWPFYFAPIVHWQNLPSLDKPEGEPDITADLLAMQDRVNFVSSNASKIIRFYAHPQRFSRFYNAQEKAKMGPDEMPNFGDANGGIFQLEPLGDMAGVMAYLKLLRQAMFDRARVIDIDSMQDKIGALTNFGMRVLYQDNINLINTHRKLFGDALEDLVNRLLIIGGRPPVPCKIVWRDWMPVNEVEETAAIQADMAAGLLSKQTAAGLRGYDWEKEQMRIADEKTAEGDIGTAILEAFNRGA